MAVKDPLGFITNFAYSYQDIFTETTINPQGLQTLSIHDARGWVAESLKKNPKGEIIQKSRHSYNKNGKPVQLEHTIFCGTSPVKSITHHWEYGPMDRMERFLEAGEKETRYLYDERGRLQKLIKPDGCRIEHEYDDLGRLARYFSHDFDYHYTYDRSDRITAVYDKLSKTTTIRRYDPLGCLLHETLSNDLSFNNTYDIRSRRTTCTLPDTSRIDYTYEGIYLHSVTRKGYTHVYSQRNLEGKIVNETLPSSLGEVTIARDAVGRCQNFTSAFYTAHYPKEAYDPAGNLTHYTYQDPLGKVTCTYAYDDLDQLIAEDSHTYLFDSLNNRLKKDDRSQSVNAFCQITHDGINPFCYDTCGNLISDGVRQYTYDSLDRLIAIDEDNTRIEFTYDPFHRRLSKTILVNGRQTSCIRYMWDGDNEIGTVDEQGRIQELRVLGEGLGAEIGSAVLYELNGKSYMPIHDHRGCVVVLVTPGTKQPIESYRYTAYGEELTDNKLSPWRFASKRVDETGLVFFGRRYYQPTLGRWITQDPQGFDDGPNLYAYLGNSPLSRFDLYGLYAYNDYSWAAYNPPRHFR